MNLNDESDVHDPNPLNWMFIKWIWPAKLRNGPGKPIVPQSYEEKKLYCTPLRLRLCVCSERVCWGVYPHNFSIPLFNFPHQIKHFLTNDFLSTMCDFNSSKSCIITTVGVILLSLSSDLRLWHPCLVTPSKNLIQSIEAVQRRFTRFCFSYQEANSLSYHEIECTFASLKFEIINLGAYKRKWML